MDSPFATIKGPIESRWLQDERLSVLIHKTHGVKTRWVQPANRLNVSCFFFVIPVIPSPFHQCLSIPCWRFDHEWIERQQSTDDIYTNKPIPFGFFGNWWAPSNIFQPRKGRTIPFFFEPAGYNGTRIRTTSRNRLFINPAGRFRCLWDVKQASNTHKKAKQHGSQQERERRSYHSHGI